jgi:hypothetical protein
MITQTDQGIPWFKDKDGWYSSGHPFRGLSIKQSGRLPAFDKPEVADDKRWWELIVWGNWRNPVIYRGKSPADCMRVAEIWLASR